MAFPLHEITFLLKGPAGELEVLVSPAKNSTSPETVAVICHPHPLFGGTMTNKVVSTLARTFLERGVHVVRFNFRGVGKSTGHFDEGVGEVDDLLAVISWVKMVLPESVLWLAGFSFGGYIAAKVATQLPVGQLVTVAPLASRFTANPFPPIQVPWILVQGDADEIVPPEEVYDWIDSLSIKPHLIRISAASHFFHGQLMELRRLLNEALNKLK